LQPFFLFLNIRVLHLSKFCYHSFCLQRSLFQLGMTVMASQKFLRNTPSELLLPKTTYLQNIIIITQTI
jgi:hypothetical protein